MAPNQSSQTVNPTAEAQEVGPAAAHAVAVIERAPASKRQSLFDLIKSTLQGVPADFRLAVEARVKQKFSDLL